MLDTDILIEVLESLLEYSSVVLRPMRTDRELWNSKISLADGQTNIVGVPHL